MVSRTDLREVICKDKVVLGQYVAWIEPDYLLEREISESGKQQEKGKSPVIKRPRENRKMHA